MSDEHKGTAESDENHLGDTLEQRKERLMRFERTRHLMVWGDGSTLNHGHL